MVYRTAPQRQPPVSVEGRSAIAEDGCCLPSGAPKEILQPLVSLADPAMNGVGSVMLHCRDALGEIGNGTSSTS